MSTFQRWGDIPDWAYSCVLSILQTLKLSDSETYYHCLRVGEASRKIARDAGLNEYQQKLAEFAGLLHDVGKIGVDKTVIHKPSRLDEKEMEHMKMHPILSAQILDPFAHHDLFAQLQPAVRAHHERMDGEGYPDKKRGEEIPLLARLVLVADTVDAMTHNRPYRKGLPIEVVYKELQKYSGIQFDPQLVQIFLKSHAYWTPEEKDSETFHRISKRVA